MISLTASLQHLDVFISPVLDSLFSALKKQWKLIRRSDENILQPTADSEPHGLSAAWRTIGKCGNCSREVVNCFGIYSTYSNLEWKMWLWKHIISILSYTHKEFVFKSFSVIHAQILWHYISPCTCFSQVPEWIPKDAVVFFLLKE